MRPKLRPTRREKRRTERDSAKRKQAADKVEAGWQTARDADEAAKKAETAKTVAERSSNSPKPRSRNSRTLWPKRTSPSVRPRPRGRRRMKRCRRRAPRRLPPNSRSERGLLARRFDRCHRGRRPTHPHVERRDRRRRSTCSQATPRPSPRSPLRRTAISYPPPPTASRSHGISRRFGSSSAPSGRAIRVHRSPIA